MKTRTNTGSRVTRTMLALGAVAAVALGAAALAQAGTELHGATGAGHAKVKLALNDDGTVASFAVENADIPCKHGVLRNADGIYRNFKPSAPGSFAGKLSERSANGKFKFRSRDSFSGIADANGTWSGRFKTRINVLKRGHKIDSCRLDTAWLAA